MGRTIEMKMARASLAEVEALGVFLRDLDAVLNCGEFVDDSDPEDVRDVKVGEDEFADWVRDRFERIECSWRRVVWNADTLLRNCADDTLPHLDWRADVRAFLDQQQGANHHDDDEPSEEAGAGGGAAPAAEG